MLITDDKKLEDIQREFQEMFPWLKLEFYTGTYEPGHASPANQQLDPRLTIGQVRTVRKEGDLKISPDMTVRELEQKFWDQYGLLVQVFRRSGKIWLQTSKTDEWTLGEQNRKGERSVDSWLDMHGED
ncbi:MAG: hypothetical protein KatS3mg030_371 [Saprospiraceae bacterium]|nr:MAG: hypothetical protein KatS3mg030_371 [Saprospiraceae bacterium]